MNAPRCLRSALPGLLFLLGFGNAAPLRAVDTFTDSFSKAPATDEIRLAHVFEERLVPMGGKPADAAQNRALADALAAYQKARIAAGPSSASEVDSSSFERFLNAYPASPWRVALLANLGVEYYHRGEFSKALDAWQKAWAGGKDATDPAAVALVDRALGELARMEARLGRVDDLKTLFAQAGDRTVTGLGASAYYGAKGGLANMEQRPEASFKCGPWALDSILSFANPAHPYRAKLKAYPSTDHGVSLASVAALATELKMDLVPAQRTGTGLTVPTPAVVNWKLGHYGALLREKDGRYLLQDPTFGNSQWITQAALDEEASGYFLVASPTLKTTGWQAVSDERAQKVWGKGVPSGYPPPGPPPPPEDPPDSPPCDSCPCDDGMATWRIRLSEVDLAVTDTPLSYQPPVGPAIRFHVSYEQRDANQPATLSFSNLGFQWNFNWITTLTFDSNNAYVNYGDSGQEIFAGFTSSSTDSGVSDLTRTRLVKTGSTGYQLIAPDGSLKVFGLADGSGRYYMTKVIDTLGNAVTLGYDSQFRLTTITDAIGQASKLAYGNASDPLKITAITDPFNRKATFTYNTSNQLSQITDAAGLTSKFTYASGGNVIDSLTTGYGKTQFATTESGLDRTLIVTFPDGSQEKAQSLGSATKGFADSDPANLLPKGIPEFNNYLSERNTSYWDRKAMIEAPDDPTKARVYHYLHGNNLQKGPILESLKLPQESRIWYYYQGQEQPGFINTDGQNMINRPSYVARVLDDGSTQLFRYAYNLLGNVTQIVDPLGRTTNYLYDTNNIDVLQIQQVTGPATHETQGIYTYNAHHQPLIVGDAAGQTTVYTYNAAGQVLTYTDAANQKTTWAYDAKGYLQSVSGPLVGNTNKVTYTYDSAGRIASITDALGAKVSYTYDNLNRPTLVTYPDNTTEQLQYTLLNVGTFTDRLKRKTTFTYSSLDQLTAITDQIGRVTQFGYCRCGGLISIIDPLGQTTRFDYDIQSRPISRTFDDGSTATYAYETLGGRLKSRTDSKGQTTLYQYEPDNRIKLVTYPNALKPTPAVRFAYDPIYPRLTSMTDGTGTTNYTFNPITGIANPGAGQLVSQQGPFGTVSRGFDALGRVTSRTVDGVVETVGYNALNVVTSDENTLGKTTYGYVANSRLPSAITLPNGVKGAITYQPASGNSFLKQILYKNADASALSAWGYVFNARQNVTGWTQQRGSSTATAFTFGYDGVDRLTNAATTNPTGSYAYSYDAADNRLKETVNGTATSATYNSLNELASLAPPPEADRTYEWDAEDRLVAINYTSTTNRTEFAYDGAGRRVQIVEKTGATVNSTTRLIWDELNLCEAKDGSGAVTKRYFAQGMQIVSGSNAGLYYYTRDHLGSIREVTDASGALRARYDYDAWGRRTRTSGNLDADFGFTGLYHHAASGLDLAVYRAYDSDLGRWINRDPIDEAGGLNLYAYTTNNPISLYDPTGLKKIKICPGQTTGQNGTPVPQKGDTVTSTGTGNTYTYDGSGFSGVGPDGTPLPYQPGKSSITGGYPGGTDTTATYSYPPYSTAPPPQPGIPMSIYGTVYMNGVPVYTSPPLTWRQQ